MKPTSVVQSKYNPFHRHEKGKKITPLKLNAPNDVTLLSRNVGTISIKPTRQIFFRNFSKLAEDEARGSDSSLFISLNLFGNVAVKKLLDIIDSRITSEEFSIDLEEISSALFESLGSLNGEFADRLYKYLDMEEKQILRELVIAAVEYHNEENGLNIELVNSSHYNLARVEIAQSRFTKVLQGLADGSTLYPDRDVDNASAICAELRRLEAVKERIIGHSHTPGEYPPFSIRHDLPFFADRYGYKNGQGFREKYNLKNLKLPYGTFPKLDQNMKVSTYLNLNCPKGDSEKEIEWTYMDGLGYIPIFEGIMKARNSTGSFTQLIGDMSDSIKGQSVFQIGYSHGGITKKLAEVAGVTVGVDILGDAEGNANYTLSELPEGIRNNVTLVCGDLSYLIHHVAQTQQTAKYLFFNCPIFKGEIRDLDDFNSMAGDDFEVIKRTLEMLPQILDKDGEAYLLVGYPRSEQGKERLWTLDKLRGFLNSELPSYECKALRAYKAPYNEHGTYGIVRINRKAISS